MRPLGWYQARYHGPAKPGKMAKLLACPATGRSRDGSSPTEPRAGILPISPCTSAIRLEFNVDDARGGMRRTV